MGKTIVNNNIKLKSGGGIINDATDGLSVSESVIGDAAYSAILLQYCDGSDGDVTISVDTTLSRNMFYNNLTINDGIKLIPNGYLIFVKETINCIGTGKIAQDYNSSSPDGKILPAPVEGAAAKTSDTGGNNGSASVKSLSNLAGKNGGAVGSYAGGAGGAVSSLPNKRKNTFVFGNFYDIEATSVVRYTLTGGAGGGARGDGWSATSAGYGGAGGTSGGMIFVVARTIGVLNLSAIGGPGENGGDGSKQYGDGGGGGAGGNGGYCFVAYKNKTTITATLTGGAGGAGGTRLVSGSNGEPGSAGNSGILVELVI